MNHITRVLAQTLHGEPHAAEELLPLVYNELRRLAAYKMAQEYAGQTLQATALVHEAWLRLSKESRPGWQNQQQFYAMASEVMRRILVDRARRRSTCKHGGQFKRVEMDVIELPVPENDALVLDVHDALGKLEVEDARQAEVVKLRFFTGLDNSEIAAILGVSEKTVEREWAFAKAWLLREMRQ